MSELTEFQKFEKCTTTKIKTGSVEIYCIKGLWDVESSTLQKAVVEAKHYFLQYLGDGEYYDIIGGKSPAKLFNT